MEYKARERYQDKQIVQQYDEQRFRSLKGRLTDWLEKSAMIRAVRYANISPPAILLDIPCGTGRLSSELAQAQYRIIAGDISVSMLQMSRMKIRTVNSNFPMTYTVLDAVKLPFIPAIFDAVVSLRLFGHVPPPIRSQMIQEFARVSKHYLIIAYYHRNCLQGWLRIRKRKTTGIPWYPVSFAEIDRELEQAGLDRIKIFPMLLGISETVVVVARKK